MTSTLFLRLCALFLVAAWLMPPEGTSVELCLFKRVTGLPCPGCGMTRCTANLLRGRVTRAVQFHPLGIGVVPVIAGLGTLGLLPRSWRERVRSSLEQRRPLVETFSWLAGGAFLVFGIVRLVAVATGLAHFPAAWPS